MFRDFGRTLAPSLIITDDVNDALSPFRAGALSSQGLKMDLIERPEEYVVHMEVPGIPKDKINIDVYQNVLTVSAEREKSFKDEGENYFRMERSYGQLSRSMRLPKNVDSDNIAAQFDNGELKITVPKVKSESREAKKITIH